MKLRAWQAECISAALHRYHSGQSHFLCLATPGAGKTIMAATLAKQLLHLGLIDLVLCFSPSVVVADDFRAELETQIGERMDGVIGSRGCSLTYQSMLSLPDNFWTLFAHHRVFVIFDEIHHCAGQTPEMANAWGEKILCEIQGRAKYTLALTGTPWRSDRIPIVLSRYRSEKQQIHCDYQYGLYQSIQDRVCRTPRVIVIDNDRITVNEGYESKKFESIKAMLENSCCSYQQLIENEALISYFLSKANSKLNEIRKSIPNAGGLIVAASVTHAHQIARLLKNQLNQHAAIATYYEEDALGTIREFKSSDRKWIISVGMISEGTNIPRLRVCCHLTRVKTELYFRQVLGRILRSSGNDGEAAYFYMPAEPTLTQYAERLAEDIPTMEVVRFEKVKTPHRASESKLPISTVGENSNWPNLIINLEPGSKETQLIGSGESINSPLSLSYASTVNLFGRFRQEILALRLGAVSL